MKPTLVTSSMEYSNSFFLDKARARERERRMMMSSCRTEFILTLLAGDRSQI